MSSFRTILTTLPATFSIDHQSSLLCMGSCFAQHIGELLSEGKFEILLNPFGILYNPVSIGKGLEIILSDRLYAESDLVNNAGLWYSFDHHGFFSGVKRREVLNRMNVALTNSRNFLSRTRFLIITFGTASVFVKKASGEVVANCHKFPGYMFEKKRLTIDQVVLGFSKIVRQVLSVYPKIHIIFTLSPVRHIRDGLIENQLSKATLLLAIEKLTSMFPEASYFPAYELVMDDLRDYRFYQKDHIHPNELAIQYIWDFFRRTYFLPNTESLYKKVKKVVQSSQHRSFHPETTAHQQFLQNQLEIIDKLERQYDFIDFSKEKKIFSSQLIV